MSIRPTEASSDAAPRLSSPMLNPDALFTSGNAIALLGWLGLVFAPAPLRFRWALAAATLLALLYALHVVPALGGIDFADFSTLAGVMKLQGSAAAAAVGWVHYLAFDLVAGTVIAYDADRRAITRWLVVPALALTYLLGPVGWLVYGLIRAVVWFRRRA